MSPRAAFEWVDIDAPAAVLREADSDGLVINVRSMTLPLASYGDFYLADVTAVARGILTVHNHVLLTGDEAGMLAGRLDDALKRPASDRTVSLFDDGMTMKLEGDGHGRWLVECRPVPLPPPNATWDTFPVYSFGLGAAAMQRAIADLERLSEVLARRREALRPVS